MNVVRFFLKIILALLALEYVAVADILSAQHHSETIRETVKFETPEDVNNLLKVYNIRGDVIIEGHDEEVVEIVAEKSIEARRQKYVDQGQEEVQLKVEEDGDLILVYLDAPYINVKKRGSDISYNIDNPDRRYDLNVDITIKVPKRVNVHASTITDGKVVVNQVQGGEINASNVNGEVVLNGVSGKTNATTVNGDISAVYSENPPANSKFQTVNGTIDVMFPENLSADIRFKSLQGDLYTDFENITYLKPQVENNKRNRRGGVSYRIDKFSPLRIGSGGPEFSFEVLNGDVYVRQIKS